MKENHRKDPALIPVICYSCGTPMERIQKEHKVYCPDCLKYLAEAISQSRLEKEASLISEAEDSIREEYLDSETEVSEGVSF